MKCCPFIFFRLKPQLTSMCFYYGFGNIESESGAVCLSNYRIIRPEKFAEYFVLLTFRYSDPFIFYMKINHLFIFPIAVARNLHYPALLGIFYSIANYITKTLPDF